MTRARTILAAALATVSSAMPATAAEFSLTVANDAIAPQEYVDDLYTADTRLAVHVREYRLEIGERMFTDRERGWRFDETHLEVSKPIPALGGWQGEVGLGVLHVGRGLLGEGVQNALHRLIGNSEVELEYAAEHRLYPRGRLDVWRPLAQRSRTGARLHVTAVAVPDFDSHARVSLEAQRTIARDTTILAGVGTLSHHVETDLLAEVIPESGATWSLALAWRNVTVGYAYNLYGTETGHLVLRYLFSPSDWSPRRSDAAALSRVP